MDRAAHHFADVHRAADHRVRVAGEQQVLGAHAEGDRAGLYAVLLELCLLLIREENLCPVEDDGIPSVLLYELGVIEVHLRHSDEAGNEQVRRVVKDFLRRADLLDETVLHDDDAVAEGHRLGLVVGDVDKGGVDALAQLNELGTHLVAELGVQIGQRLVHEQDLGFAHDRAADGDALPLAAGECLRLAVEVLGDAEDVRGLRDALRDLLLGNLAQLERKRHVLRDRHMRIERVVLEYHRDVAVLRRNVVDERAVDVQLAARDLLETCDHAQGGGLAAAGRADENDKLLVLDGKIEVMHGEYAFVGHGEVAPALLRALFLLLFAILMRIDLFDVFKDYFSHVLLLLLYIGGRSGKITGA